jgi:hypothetical protein
VPASILNADGVTQVLHADFVDGDVPGIGATLYIGDFRDARAGGFCFKHDERRDLQ